MNTENRENVLLQIARLKKLRRTYEEDLTTLRRTLNETLNTIVSYDWKIAELQAELEQDASEQYTEDVRAAIDAAEQKGERE